MLETVDRLIAPRTARRAIRPGMRQRLKRVAISSARNLGCGERWWRRSPRSLAGGALLGL